MIRRLLRGLPRGLGRPHPWALALALAGAAAGSAQAATYDFSFNNNGFALPTPCGSGCYDVGASGNASTANLGGISWAYFASANVATGTGVANGTWSLQDLGDAGNDLSGSFVGHLISGSAKGASASIDYVVTGGSGIFSGLVGRGMSSVSATPDFTYSESGRFHVSSVPEPASAGLLAAGLVGVAWAARRRRRTQAV